MSSALIAQVGEVADINPTFKSTTISPDELVDFLPMAAVEEGNSVVQATEFRALAEVQKGYTSFSDGDVLLAKITPCFENGKIAQVRLKHRCGFGSTEFHVLRPHVGKLDGRYLVHFLRRDEIRIDGARKMTGSAGQRRVPKHYLESLPIYLPPLSEQRRIAAILDQADALRAKRREALAQLDSLTQSIFIEMFGDPVTNPKGWPLNKLGTIGKLDRGVSKHRPRNAPELLGGPYPLIQTGDVANSDGYIRSYASTYSEFGLRQSKLWPAGTLCITIAANIAKTGILTFDACFPDSVVGFSAEDPATVEFIRVWLSFLQKMLEESAPESAQKNINLAILRDLDVPVPPLSQQIQFAAAITAQRKLTEAHQADAIELDSLFASLQHRAFRGEL